MAQHFKGEFDLSRAKWQQAVGEQGNRGSVEVAFVDDLIGVRNSAEPDGPVRSKPVRGAVDAGLHAGKRLNARQRR